MKQNKSVSNYLKLCINYMLNQAREFGLKLSKRGHYRFRMGSGVGKATRLAIQCLVIQQCKWERTFMYEISF